MSWDAWQRDVLEELGHVPWVLAGPELPRLPDDPLLHALLRAAGCGAHQPEAHALLRSLPPLAVLRGDPVALRAAWPRLRAVRRTLAAAPGGGPT